MLEEMLTRGWNDLVGRIGGPMSFRIVIQPTVALVLAVVAGRRDARTGQLPFLWDFIANPSHRFELIRQGWKDIGKVFLVAAILDSIYQVTVQRAIYPLELLITATVLAIVPYAIARALITRVLRRFGRKPGGGDAGNQTLLNEDQQPKRKED